jgi:hypothetical protein
VETATGSRPSIAPGHGIDIWKTADRLLSANEIGEAVLGKNSRLYMFGTISYLDIFERRWTTDFCSSVVGSPNLKTIVSGGTEEVAIAYEPCNQHNKIR